MQLRVDFVNGRYTTFEAHGWAVAANGNLLLVVDDKPAIEINHSQWISVMHGAPTPFPNIEERA